MEEIVHIKEVVKDFLSKTEKKKKEKEKIKEKINEIMENLLEERLKLHIKLNKIYGNTLFFNVDSSGAGYHLFLYKKRILQEVRKFYPYIKSLKISVR